MANTRRCPLITALALGALGFPTVVHSQPNEAALVNAMRGIASEWNRLAQTGEALPIACQNRKFTGVRLSPNSSVSVDLQQTSSLMNPYLGVVSISGRFQWNRGDDGHCVAPSPEAVGQVPWYDNNRDYNIVIYYQVEGDEFRLTGGNQIFQNGVLNQSGTLLFDNSMLWQSVFRHPIQ